MNSDKIQKNSLCIYDFQFVQDPSIFILSLLLCGIKTTIALRYTNCTLQIQKKTCIGSYSHRLYWVLLFCNFFSEPNFFIYSLRYCVVCSSSIHPVSYRLLPRFFFLWWTHENQQTIISLTSIYGNKVMKVTFDEQNKKPNDGTMSDTGRRNTIITTNVGISIAKCIFKR